MWDRLRRRLEPICFKVTSIIVEPPVWFYRRKVDIGVWVSALVIWAVGLFGVIPYIQNGLDDEAEQVPLTIGVIGALFLGTVGLFGLYVNYRRTRAFEKQLEQQLYATNVEHLGHISESVRLGGIYGLERLAKGSKDLDEPWVPKVAEILCAHIRTTTTKDSYGNENESKPSNEIAAILKVLLQGENNPFSLTQFDLSRSNLRGSDLRGANLIRTDLFSANLIGADLSGVNLTQTNLREANLSKADLQGADLREICLQDTNLSRANLVGADLSRSKLSGTDTKKLENLEAHLLGVIVDKANLSGVNLGGANLTESDMMEVDLSKVNLAGADLSRANLIGANLSRTDLFRTKLNRTILSGTNLTGAMRLSGNRDKWADFSGCVFDTAFSLGGLTNLEDIYWGIYAHSLGEAALSDVGTDGRESEERYLAVNAVRRQPTQEEKEQLVGKENVDNCKWGDILVLEKEDNWWW